MCDDRRFIYSYRGDFRYGWKPASMDKIVREIEKSEQHRRGEAANYQVYEIKPVEILVTDVERVIVEPKIRLDTGE